MNKYLESIESMEQVGTAPYKQSPPDSAVVLEMSSDTPSMTYAEPPAYEEIIQVNTPPEMVRVDRTNGASRPLKWCMATAAMVH